MDKYGTLTSYAPSARTAGVRLEHIRSQGRLLVEFHGGHVWRVPLQVERSKDARQFIGDAPQYRLESSAEYRAAG